MIDVKRSALLLVRPTYGERIEREPVRGLGERPQQGPKAEPYEAEKWFLDAKNDK